MTETLFHFFSWTTGYGVVLLFFWFIYRFIRNGIHYYKQPTFDMAKRSVFSLATTILLILGISIASNLMLLHLLKKEIDHQPISVLGINGLYYSKYELKQGLEAAYLLKYESGHHPIGSEFMIFSFDAYPSIRFRINPDNRDAQMYWLSVENILGDGHIGFIRL